MNFRKLAGRTIPFEFEFKGEKVSGRAYEMVARSPMFIAAINALAKEGESLPLARALSKAIKEWSLRWVDEEAGIDEPFPPTEENLALYGDYDFLGALASAITGGKAADRPTQSSPSGSAPTAS